MTARRALLLVAVASAVAAALLYHAATARASVVVAARDLDALHPIVAEDVAVRSFPIDGVPDGSLADPQDALGKRLRMPLATGQLVLSAVLAEDGALFQSGLLPPSGTRAIALPVTPGQALGGAIAPGARIDVVAVPAQGRAPAGRATELLLTSVVVLDVRTESGAPVARLSARTAVTTAPERLGSVVVAVPLRDEIRVADRIGTSTFVLVLAAAR